MIEKKIIKIIQEFIKEKKIKKNILLNKIKGWDSINHLNILMEIEKKLKIKFKIDEMSNFKNIGEIINCVKKKINI